MRIAIAHNLPAPRGFGHPRLGAGSSAGWSLALRRSEVRSPRARDKDVIESKRAICRPHPSCVCILPVRQDRAELIVEQRTAGGWRSRVLGASDDLTLPEFGLACPIKEIYRDTPLA
jgi:hypothetical protein